MFDGQRAVMYDDPWGREIVERLERFLARVTYKDGWSFKVDAITGQVMLAIAIKTADSVTGLPTVIQHRMPVPWRFDEQRLRRWLLEQIFAVETHEAMEFFLVDGAAPFFPAHDGSRSPYAVVERDEPVRADGRLERQAAMR